MTRYQKLEKAKNESLEKWKKLIGKAKWFGEGRWGYVTNRRCGFCDIFGHHDDNLDFHCGGCPIRAVEGKPCFEVKSLEHIGCIKTESLRISRCLAVMVYIHGFTVDDLPEEK